MNNEDSFDDGCSSDGSRFSVRVWDCQSAESRARAVIAIGDLMSHCDSLAVWARQEGSGARRSLGMVGPEPDGYPLSQDIDDEASRYLKVVWAIVNGERAGTAGFRCRYRRNRIEVHVSSGALELSAASPEGVDEALSLFNRWGVMVDGR